MKNMLKSTALNTSQIRSKLKLKSLQSELDLKSRHPEAVQVLESKGIRPGKIRYHAKKLLAAGSLAGSLLVSPLHTLSIRASVPEVSTNISLPSSIPLHTISEKLNTILPTPGSQLSPDQESQITSLIKKFFAINATPELEGNRLNQSYGLIGVEQHLARFPGDNVPNMAPGRGAWGYFANSRSELTPDLEATEKYYVAVQTLYLPDWHTRFSYLRDWYKYRHVVVINPANGMAIVAAIADSGPAAWTGKHFGGSPEVMEYLHMHDGRQKGPVVLFFLDDPDKKIPLGPLEYNKS